MKKIMVFLLLLSLLLAPSLSFAETFSKYTGESTEDMALAKKFYEKMHDFGVKAVEVFSSIMVVHVTSDLYKEMYYNRVDGNQLMRNWQKTIARHYEPKHDIGTVQLMVNGHKLAECWSSGFLTTKVQVKWYDD